MGYAALQLGYVLVALGAILAVWALLEPRVKGPPDRGRVEDEE